MSFLAQIPKVFCETNGAIVGAITLSRGEPRGRRWRFWNPGDLPDQNTGSYVPPEERAKKVLALVSKAK